MCLVVESVYLNLFSSEEGMRAQWRSTRINYAKGTQLIYIVLTFLAYVFLRIVLFFFFKGFRLYLRPFRSKWIGRAFAFWPAYFFPGLLVSVSLWLWAPALAAISLLFSVWVGRVPRCLPRVFTYTAH